MRSLLSGCAAYRGPRWEKDPVTSFSEWCEGGSQAHASIGTSADGEVCMAPVVV